MPAPSAPDYSRQGRFFIFACASTADDVQTDDSGYSIVTSPTSFEAVKRQLRAEGVEWLSAELTQMATNTVPLDEAGAKKVLRLIEVLEELDEVQDVYANFDIPDEVLEQVSGE